MVYHWYTIPGMVASATADKAIKSCNLPDSICSLLCDVDEDYAATASKFVWSVDVTTYKNIAILRCTGH